MYYGNGPCQVPLVIICELYKLVYMIIYRMLYILFRNNIDIIERNVITFYANILFAKSKCHAKY